MGVRVGEREYLWCVQQRHQKMKSGDSEVDGQKDITTGLHLLI